MAIQATSPYNFNRLSGLPPGAGFLASSNLAPPTPPNWDALQRSLGSDLLNASRTPIDASRLAGLKNDESVMLVGQHKLPKTGYPALDNGIEKVAGVTGYVPQAAMDALTKGLRWGSFGGVGVSAGIAALLVLLKVLGHDAKAVPGFKLVLTAACGAAAGLTLGMGAFAYSLLDNLRDVHFHLTKDPSELKPKKVI